MDDPKNWSMTLGQVLIAWFSDCRCFGQIWQNSMYTSCLLMATEKVGVHAWADQKYNIMHISCGKLGHSGFSSDAGLVLL